MIFGHLTNGYVDEVLKASRRHIRSLPNASEWVELPYGAALGWHFNAPTDTWSGPNGESLPDDPASTPTYRKIVTPAEFIDLFPAEAYTEIKTNLVGTNPEITKMYDYAFSKKTINLNSPRLPFALDILIQESSLTQQDADIILQGILEE